MLDIKVTRLEKTTFKKSFVGWDLDAETKKSTPYFVRATVTNLGDDRPRRPAGAAVHRRRQQHPARGDAVRQHVQALPAGAVPQEVRAGQDVKVCLVYLRPTRATWSPSASGPTQDYDPITWTGELKSPRPPKKDSKGDKGSKGDGDDGGGDDGGNG